MFFKYVTFSANGTRIVSAMSSDVSTWDAGVGALGWAFKTDVQMALLLPHWEIQNIKGLYR